MTLEGDLRQDVVVETALRKKNQWLRKIEEMPEERLGSTVYVEKMPGERPRGRLRMGRRLEYCRCTKLYNYT